MRASGWKLAGLVTLGATLGCGGTNGGSGNFSTSLPSGTQIENLTSAQADQLCNEVNSYLGKRIDSVGFCQVAAVMDVANQAMQDTTLTDAQLQQLCSSETTTICSLLNADGGTNGAPDGGSFSCGSTADCMATVTQLSACVNATATSFVTFENLFPSCRMVTRAKLASANTDASPTEPSSCITVDNSCPNFSPMLNLGALGGQ